MGVHGVEEVGEGHLSALLPHVGAQLGDGGAHAQRAHRHRQLVDAVDVAGARVQVEALAELCECRVCDKVLSVGCVIPPLSATTNSRVTCGNKELLEFLTINVLFFEVTGLKIDKKGVEF